MKSILIIGKKSFLGSNLNIFLKKKFNVISISYKELTKKNLNYFKQFNYVINTTIKKGYIDSKYVIKNDLDRNFINKFDKIPFNYIFFNSRKIYKPGININENSKLNPRDNYSKNKLITENYLKKKIKFKLLSLRISNVIGKRIYKQKKNTHKLP